MNLKNRLVFMSKMFLFLISLSLLVTSCELKSNILANQSQLMPYKTSAFSTFIEKVGFE